MEPIYINQQALKTNTNALSIPNFPWLIGIGASAGGVETLKELLVNLPDQLINSAVFIGFPMDKSDIQMLSAAIDSKCSISFKQAKQGEQIKPGFIYYTSFGYELDIKGTRLQLNILTEDIQSNPVDTLFNSLSVAAGEKSIGIVLSGMGADGAKGIKIIKEAGGYVLVQSPETAMYNAMPIAAIKTNCVDLVLPPFKMGNAILHTVQLQPVPADEYIVQNEPGKKTGLAHPQTAMAIKKNGAITNAGTKFFTGDLCSNQDIFSFDAMVKETLFNCYQHTYLIVNSSFIIKEFKGNTDLFMTGVNNPTNEHLWSVIKETIKAAVMVEVTKATATLQVTTGSIEIIGLYNEFSFIRIIVKPILDKSGSMLYYLIILENLQPKKFEVKEVHATNSTWA